jgi:hypothetical protein
MLIDLNRDEVKNLIEAINPPVAEHEGNGPNHLPAGHKMSGLLARLLTMSDLHRAETEAERLQEYVERESCKLRRE